MRISVEKGGGGPTSYIVVSMGGISSMEREVLDLSKLKWASSEEGPASAVSEEGIFLRFSRISSGQATPGAMAKVTGRCCELGRHTLPDESEGTVALRAAAEVVPTIALAMTVR